MKKKKKSVMPLKNPKRAFTMLYKKPKLSKKVQSYKEDKLKLNTENITEVGSFKPRIKTPQKENLPLSETNQNCVLQENTIL